jgi:hypothetical protein
VGAADDGAPAELGVALADDVRAAPDADDVAGSDVADGVADGVAVAVVGVLVPGAGVDEGAACCDPAFVRSPTVVPCELDPVTMAETGRCPISSMPVTITIAATNTAAAAAPRRT